MKSKFYLTECPRDAMQGIQNFIPTERKIEYINLLLGLGFDRLDFGSFVSSKAIPQLADTKQVISNLIHSKTSLLAIVANERGASEACEFERIDFLGYPFSINNTFQIRNTGKSIENSLPVLSKISETCSNKNKKLVIYLSMAFGNPYNEEYSLDQIFSTVHSISKNASNFEFMLSDTIGSSNTESIQKVYSEAVKSFPSIKWGLHLHSTAHEANEKIKAALESGCTRFDSAFGGLGGCPMASDSLTGNIPTEKLLPFIPECTIDLSSENLQKIAHFNNLFNQN